MEVKYIVQVLSRNPSPEKSIFMIDRMRGRKHEDLLSIVEVHKEFSIRQMLLKHIWNVVNGY